MVHRGRSLAVLLLLCLLFAVSCGRPPGKKSSAPQDNVDSSGDLLSHDSAKWLIGEWNTVPGSSPEPVKGQPGAYSATLSVETAPRLLRLTRLNDQVGDVSDTMVPYPTWCSYRFTSTDFFLTEVRNPKAPKVTHEFSAKLTGMELLGESLNNDACQVFIYRNMATARRNRAYLGFFRNPDDSILFGELKMVRTVTVPAPGASASPSP